MTSRRLSALVRAAERDIEAARRLLPDMPDQAIFREALLPEIRDWLAER